jgi:hypothetical protein
MTRLFVIMAATAALVVGIVSFVHLARGHDAHLYDPDCCGDSDCAPVEASGQTPDGLAWFKTKHGRVVLDAAKFPAVKYRQTKDHRIHVCMTAGTKDWEKLYGECKEYCDFGGQPLPPWIDPTPLCVYGPSS